MHALKSPLVQLNVTPRVGGRFKLTGAEAMTVTGAANGDGRDASKSLSTKSEGSNCEGMAENMRSAKN